MKDKIIVTMTSYKGRINNVSRVIYSILNNSLKPHKVVINLSSDEFPDMLSELPSDLLLLYNANLVEIYWVKENIKQFKKLIPTLERYPNDIIISIDDDIYYPSNFIETIYNDYISNDRKNPVTCGYWKHKNYYFGEYSHHGSFSLVTFSMFANVLDEMKSVLANELWKHIWLDDPFYTYFLLKNNIKYIKSSFNGEQYKNGHFKNRGISYSNYNKVLIEHKFLKKLLWG